MKILTNLESNVSKEQKKPNHATKNCWKKCPTDLGTHAGFHPDCTFSGILESFRKFVCFEIRHQIPGLAQLLSPQQKGRNLKTPWKSTKPILSAITHFLLLNLRFYTFTGPMGRRIHVGQKAKSTLSFLSPLSKSGEIQPIVFPFPFEYQLPLCTKFVWYTLYTWPKSESGASTRARNLENN